MSSFPIIDDIQLRFQIVRSMTGLSRLDFSKRNDLNRYTVQALEAGHFGGRGKALQSYCDALAKEGVSCTQDWLLCSQGPAPLKIAPTPASSSQPIEDAPFRFNIARSMTGLTRREFSERNGLNRYTVEALESGRFRVHGEILQNYCDALAKEGISCTQDWLLDGKGSAPASR